MSLTEPGTPMPAAIPSAETLRLLARRRSVPALTMSSPGPGPDALDEILALAARVPDHRMVEPFRFVVLDGAGKDAFVHILASADEPAEADREKAVRLYERAPVVVAVISSVDDGHKTPVWEQHLTAGAVCQNLLIAASASGWAAQWLTGWPAYDRTVAGALQLAANDRVAGMIFIGTATTNSEERKRPDMARIVSRFSA